MPAHLGPASAVRVAATLLAATGLAAAAPSMPLTGATALAIVPESSFNGYDLAICAALMRRGFDVVEGNPGDLADAARLGEFDLVVTSLKRSFAAEQVAGLKAYLASGGAMYGNWGGPMGCPELLAACGVRNARSVYIRQLELPDSPLTAGIGSQHWVFPSFVGHVPLLERGHEMVAFDRVDGTEVARDSTGQCLGSLREEGAGRCAVLGFCPANCRFVTHDSARAAAVLDNLLAWLLPRGPRPHPLPKTVAVSLPREARISSVSVDGLPLPNPQVAVAGSLQTVAVPVDGLAEGQTMQVRVDCDLPPVRRHIETWIHDPSASSFLCFEPAQAADFLAALHATVVQPLLRYEGGSIAFARGIAGDQPRERFAQYGGDLLAEYIAACHACGIRVVGGLYLDWRRFERHLSDAPPRVAKGQPAPEEALGQAVCPLDGAVWDHNLGIIRNLLAGYPDLDGVILDDNFEFDQNPCYCQACLGRFADYCEGRPDRPDAQAEAEAGGAVWREFWVEQKVAFCGRIRELCRAHGKPVGGWTAQRGPVAFRGVLDFAGDMVYTQPPCSVAPLWPQIGDFPVVTLLWGMNRRPEEMETDFAEAVRAGSTEVGFWIQYARQEGVTDNPWSLGWAAEQGFALTPGSLGAIERAFAGAEKAWLEHYRENLVQGDRRLVVTRAELARDGLTLEVRRLARPSAERVVGPVRLPALERGTPATR